MRTLLRQLEEARRRRCPHCGGFVDPELDDDLRTVWRCRNCDKVSVLKPTKAQAEKRARRERLIQSLLVREE